MLVSVASAVVTVGTPVGVQFTVARSSNLLSASWSEATNWTSLSTTGVVEIVNDVDWDQMFYRIQEE